jgi:hypothetical protein
MRSRLSIFLNDLSLEEILYLEEELDRRKEKYRNNYAVLSVQADRKILKFGSNVNLSRLASDLRRHIVESAAVGGGTILAYSPEVSIVLFHSVAGASRTGSALLAGLPEFNGKGGTESYKISLKLGLASGPDILAPGSPRCVRQSKLVKRANQYAWKSSGEAILMDENSYQEWPERHSVVRVPFEIDGLATFRAIPGILGQTSSKYDNEALGRFLNEVANAGLQTLIYEMERIDAMDTGGKFSPNTPVSRLILEGYDPKRNGNLLFSENIATADFADRLEIVRRMLGAMGLALVRHEMSASTGV